MNVGQSVKVVFSEPEGVEPKGWKAEIKPPLPNVEHCGNLILQARRPRGDDRQIPTERIPSPRMEMGDVWSFPETTDLAPRRPINCANIIVERGVEDIQRYSG